MIKTNIKIRFNYLLNLSLTLILLMFLLSCSSQKDVINWNLEINESDLPITDRCDPTKKLTSIKSPEKPQLIPATEDREARVKVIGLPCAKNEDPPSYEVLLNRVKRITYVSDPLEPPVEIAVKDLLEIEGCCRNRTGILFFDKLEIRGLIGYRGGKDSVIYPTPAGSQVYNSSFFGFDRGGSSLITGLELSGFWDALFLDKSRRLQMGFLTGIWPVDGSLFIPLGLHFRYTFNQFPAQYSDNCNSWYAYGTLGLPIDFNTNAPIFGKSAEFQRLFYGLGLGYDWAISCDMDFSVDLGFRRMNLPLPEYTCCPSTPVDYRNPFRSSTVLLLRFGLTF